MRVAIRSAAVVLTAFVAAVFLAITTTMTSAMAATALMVGGIAAGTLPDMVMSNVLGGKYSGYNRVNVQWPAQARPYTGPNDKTMGQSVTEGANALEHQIRTRITGDDVTVVGMSAGALVTDEVLRRLLANPLPNTGHKLTIMVVADSSRQDVINESRYNPVYDYTYQPPPVTPYEITVVTGEYDGAADFPDRPWNFLAVVNAMVGAIYVHVPVMFAPLDQLILQGLKPTETKNSAGGVTWHYLIPTKTLPLVQLMPFLAPFEGVLKGIVDSGYSRNDARAAATSGVSALTAGDSNSNTLALDAGASSQSEPEAPQAQTGQAPTELADAQVGGNNRSLTQRVGAISQEDDGLDPSNEPDVKLDSANENDNGLDPDAVKASNGATDLTDGNKVSPTDVNTSGTQATTTGTTTTTTTTTGTGTTTTTTGTGTTTDTQGTTTGTTTTTDTDTTTGTPGANASDTQGADNTPSAEGSTT